MPTAHTTTATGNRPARKSFTPRSPTNRTRVSNGSDILPNVDGRTVTARRIYDIAAAIATDLGGADRISETQLNLVRRFASIATLAEEQEAKLARGEEVNVEQLAQLSSALCRLASRIGLRRVPRNVTPDLRSYLDEVSSSNEREDAE